MKFHAILFAAVTLAAASTAPAAFVINEVDSDQINTPGTDPKEFIELKGNPNESVAGLTLVCFNGGSSGTTNPPAYLAFDLTGTADANGYYIVANTGVVTPDPAVTFPTNTLQNGEDAVALYSGTNAAAWGFPAGTKLTVQAPPTGAVLIDSIVYETGADTDATWTGLNTTVYNEFNPDNPTAASGEAASIARIPDGTGTFTRTTPSPKAANIGGPVSGVSEWALY